MALSSKQNEKRVSKHVNNNNFSFEQFQIDKYIQFSVSAIGPSCWPSFLRIDFITTLNYLMAGERNKYGEKEGE